MDICIYIITLFCRGSSKEILLLNNLNISSLSNTKANIVSMVMRGPPQQLMQGLGQSSGLHWIGGAVSPDRVRSYYLKKKSSSTLYSSSCASDSSSSTVSLSDACSGMKRCFQSRNTIQVNSYQFVVLHLWPFT